MSETTNQGDASRETVLQDWTVEYGQQHLLFECQAEDIKHAIEQCENANPNDEVVGARLGTVDIVTVYPRDSDLYGEGVSGGESFQMQITDQRRSSGCMYIDVASEANLFDQMAMQVEINRLPGVNADLPCVHIGDDSDEKSLSVFKRSGQFIVCPAPGMSLQLTDFPNGVTGYAVNHAVANPDALIAEVNAKLKELRAIVLDPQSIRYSDNIAIEIRPQSEGDRILVGHQEMGVTTVNYTQEGLVVDVWPNFDKDGALEPLETMRAYRDDLVGINT